MLWPSVSCRAPHSPDRPRLETLASVIPPTAGHLGQEAMAQPTAVPTKMLIKIMAGAGTRTPGPHAHPAATIKMHTRTTAGVGILRAELPAHRSDIHGS